MVKSNELARMLTERGITQAALARHMNVDESAVSHYLAGRRLPALSQFRSMRDALGVTSDALDAALVAVFRRRARRNGKAA